MKYGIFVLELTKRCNLSCKYCSANSSITMGSNDMSEKKWKLILDKLSKLAPDFLILSGGEPLLYKHFSSILQYATNHFAAVGLTTNGTILTDELIELFIKSHITSIQISIDGLKNYHDSMRGKGTYEKICNNITCLKNNGLTVHSMTVLTRKNLFDIDLIVNELMKLGIDKIGFERLSPIGRGKQLKNNLLTPNDLKWLYEKLQSSPYITNKVSINDPIIHVAKYPNNYSFNTYLPCSGCLGGIKNFAVSPTGYLKICTRVPIVIDKVEKVDFNHLFTDYDILKKLAIRDLDGKCSKCKRVMYCGGCRADALGTTGSLFESDNTCWI